MSGTKDVIYWYDGSYEGFLCCVFESYLNHELPYDIWEQTRPETSFFPQVTVGTDREKAARVEASISRLGPRVRRRVLSAFLHDGGSKELKLLKFLRLCYRDGPCAADNPGHPVVAAVDALERSVVNEAERYLEFIRFEEREGMLGAVIKPTHWVLPLLCGHFCDRMPDEDFVIFDNTHCVALTRREKNIRYTDFIQPIIMPAPEEREKDYQQMWKAFFRALTVEERRSEKLQSGHCPKKYWDCMLEMRDAL